MEFYTNHTKYLVMTEFAVTETPPDEPTPPASQSLTPSDSLPPSDSLGPSETHFTYGSYVLLVDRLLEVIFF